MKQNAVLIFRGSFGQLVEDNIEGPSEHLIHRVVGNGRMRTEDVVQKREREINKDVQEWRLNSLRGVEGMTCPCKKYIQNLVNDEELSFIARDRAADARGFSRVNVNPAYMAAPYVDDPAFREVVLQAFRQYEAADRRDAAMLAAYGLRCTESGAVIWQRRPYVPPEQAFAMLGGYRPDRHGPWINPAWVSANPLGDEQ